MLAGLVVLLAAGCLSRTSAPEPVAESPRPKTVTIVSLTDLHGALEPRLLTTASGETLEVGGAGLIAAYLGRIRENADGPVVLVDAGDMFQGTLVSNLREGAPVVRFYNMIGMAAAAVGNHEFDFGPEGSDRVVPLSPDDDPRGALKARIGEANFPLLGVNIRNPDEEMPEWARASTTIDTMQVKVGIVGGATLETGSTTVVANVADLTFLPLPGLVEAEARRLREQGAEVVIALVHAGGACSDNQDADDLSSCADGEIFEVARFLPPGLVDVIAGGHSHAGIAKRVNGAAVIQPFAQGQYLGVATVWLDGSRPPEVGPPLHLCGGVVEGPAGPTCEARHVRTSEGPVLPAHFMGAPIVPDAVVMEALEEDFERARAIKERPLNVEATAVVSRSYDSESALGNLVADALLAAVPGAHAGVVNGGGLRAELPAGPLTYGDLFQALPFDNRIAVLDVDGATLRKIVLHGHTGGHSALSWAGLTISATDCEVTGIEIGGAALDDQARYRIVTNSYLAGGGSGFQRLGLPPDASTILWDLPVVRDVVATSLEAFAGTLSPESFYNPEAPRLRIEGSCKP